MICYIEKKMLQCSKMNEILPFYKEKRDAKCCGSYRSMKSLKHRINM